MNTKIIILSCLLNVCLLSFSQIDPGNALDFDGVNDYVQLPAANYFDSEFTIEAWVYVREYNHYPRIMDFGNGQATNNVIFTITPTTGYPLFAVYNSSGHSNLTGHEKIPLNQWVHVACVLNGSNAYIYMNGQCIAETNTMYIPENISRSECFIAKSGWDIDEYFNGKIDEFRLWNYAKTAEQIQQYMHQPLAGTENGLKVYFVFDHSTGQTLMDISNPPYYDGTLMNMTTNDWVASKAMTQPVLLPSSGRDTTRFTTHWNPINGAQMYLDVSTLSNFDTIDILDNENIGVVNSYELTGLTPGTEYYYRLKSKSSILSDYSETGMIMTRGKVPGKGIEFNGTNEWVNLKDFSLPDSFSIEFWYKADNPSVYNCIIGKHSYEGTNILIIGYYHNQMRLTIRDQIVKINDLFQDTSWTHLAAVYKKTSGSSTNITVYKNGKLVHQETLNNVLGDITGKSWVIGQDWDGTVTKDDFFDGKIDEVRFWGKPLTRQEIQSRLYSELSGNEQDLLAYYDFNAIHGSVIPDLSGNQFHGMLLPVANTMNRWTSSNAMLIPTAKEASDVSESGFTAHWDTIPGSPSYILEISDTADFSNRVHYYTLVTNTYTINSLSPGKTYYYRVKSITYITSPWSNIEKASTIITPPGNALAFDGIDDYVDLSSYVSMISGRNQGTITGWFKSNSNEGQMLFCLADGNQNTADNSILGLNSSTNTYDDESFWFVVARGGAAKLYMYVRKGDGYYSDGHWHHFAVSIGGEKNAIYIDGEEQPVCYKIGSNTTKEFSSLANPNIMRLGNRTFNNVEGYHLNGKMDEFSIWDRPLSKQEVNNIIHKELEGNEQGLLCNYDFNETRGMKLYDQSINAMQGTLMNMTENSWVESKAIITPFAKNLSNSYPDDLVVQWDSIPNAQQYYLQLSKDSDFSTMLINDSTASNYYDLKSLLDSSYTYYYRVWSKTHKLSDTTRYHITRRPGKAPYFDFVDNYAKMEGYNDTFSSPMFSITCWAKVEGGENNFRTVMSNRSVYKGNHIYAGMSNKWEFWLGDGTTWRVLYSSDNIQENTWYFIACTFDGITAKLYINGELDVEMEVLNYIPNTQYPLTIGKESESAGTYFFTGQIDELSLWDTAISCEKIYDMMRHPLNGDEHNLLAYYDFNEIYANKFSDLTGNENKLVLHNMNTTIDWKESHALITPFARQATEISNTGFTARWDSVPHASAYHFQLAVNDSFSNIIVDSVLNGNSFNATGLQEGAIYYYRVKSETYKFSGFSNVISTHTLMNIPGNAIAFNGINHRVDVATLGNANFRRGFTAECWIKVPDKNRHGKFLGFHTSDDQNLNLLNIISKKVQYYDDQIATYIGSPHEKDTLENGVWYHVAMVIKPNNECYIYQNGEQIHSFTTSVIPEPGCKFTLGCDWDPGNMVNDHYKGMMDEVRVWNYPRSENQIRAYLHKAVSPDASGLVAYYNCDNVSGTTLYDLTSNKHNGSMIFMADTCWQPSMAVIQPTAREATGVTYSSFVANWDTIPGVTDYILDISTDKHFNTIDIKDSIILHQTRYFIDTLNGETPYYYRLRYYKDSLSAYTNKTELITAARKPRIINDSITSICDYDTLILQSNYMLNNQYQWYRNDTMLPGANTNSYLLDVSGTYKFRGIDTLWNDTAWSDPVAITINTSQFGTAFSAIDSTLNAPNQGEFLFEAQFINLSSKSSTYKYFWEFGDDSTGYFNHDTVQHIYKYNGKYDVSLTVSDSLTGCFQSLSKPEYIMCKGGIDNINEEIIITGNSMLCPGDSVKLACKEHDADIYQWRKNGTNIPDANDSVYFAKQAGSYTCHLTISGISATEETISALIDTFSTIMPIISQIGILDACRPDTIALSLDTNYIHYSWSNGDSAMQTYITRPGIYSATVVDQNACQLETAPVTVQYEYIAQPSICMVTVDTSTNHNIIVWDKIPDDRVAGYYVYKEVNSDNNFVKIDSVKQGELTVVEDEQSDPKVSSDKYKISAIDTCGYETPLSAFHKTIHLQVNIGPTGERNLTWDDYLTGDYDSLNNITSTKAFGTGNYHIYRGSDSAQLSLYESRPSSTTSWSDFDTSQVYYYRVVAHKPDTCDPLGLLKASGGPYSRSVSNLEDNRLKDNNSIVKFKNLADVKVSPNPFNDQLNINLYLKHSNHVTLTLSNVLGQKISVMEKQLLDPGYHDYNLNIEMPGNTFFLEISIQNVTESIQLIKE